ncbi:hypothetical protein HELRODRAFT_190758 [Helobdella robusta]|uniref:F5/8 type C domain-containing protein n=1 Tax=Helobdella robusta TaxID=6412 RepID=T1FS98_HELRO|nr:hypothetical protein HELRODRAFT_190758 [Helobdella robusta]ESO08525.1 hypothetical protein HELRODRAFT_190758 [Helobdella robusta]
MSAVLMTKALHLVILFFLSAKADYNFIPINYVAPLSATEMMCSVHNSSTSLGNISCLECASECMEVDCHGFNFVTAGSSTSCRLFDFRSVAFQIIPGCLYYEKSCASAPPTSKVTGSKTVTVNEPSVLEQCKYLERLFDSLTSWLLNCACTNNTPSGDPAWFVIDVGSNIQLAYAVLKSSQSLQMIMKTGSTMSFFKLGISTTFDATTWKAQPSIVSYQMCGQYPNQTGSGKRYIIMCPRPPTPSINGQFVVIQQSSSVYTPFTVCEVEIYQYLNT